MADVIDRIDEQLVTAEADPPPALPPRGGRITDKLLDEDAPPLPPELRKRGKTMRYLGNGLIVVGVILLLVVGGFQVYYWWLENSTPDKQVLTGAPETTYLPSEAMATTPTVVTGNPAPTVAAGGNQAYNGGNLPVLGGGGAANGDFHPTSAPLRIVIPAIKLDSKVINIGWHTAIDPKTGTEITAWDVAEYAAGHHQGTANPGEVGNIVISGHDDYKGEVFRYLPDVKLGEEIRLYNEQGDEFIYVVTEIQKVKEEGVPLEQRIHNAQYMNPTPDQTLTLITCWPYAVDSYRWLVIAKPYNSAGVASAGGPQVK